MALALLAVGWGANQFAPMLGVYEDELGLSSGETTALFGLYAAGLVPGLLIGGPLSDRLGRRAVVLPAAIVSPLATLLLLAGAAEPALLLPARLLAGVASGVVFAAGSAWVQELSADAGEGAGPRRAAIALSLGFGTGPLVAGLLAALGKAPLVVPYLPHLVLSAAMLAWLVRTRAAPRRTDAAPARARGAVRRLGPAAVVAPWVFGAATISFAVLPAFAGDGSGPALVALVTALTLGTGVAVQAPARRLSIGAGLALGPFLAAAGCATGLAVLALDAPAAVLVAALPLGAAYGTCLVSGLREADRVAGPHDRGALVAAFYVLTYIGFAAPWLLTNLAGGSSETTALLVAGALAAVTAVLAGSVRAR